MSAAAMTRLVEKKKKHVFSWKSGPRRVAKQIKIIIDLVMRNLFENYQRYFIKTP